MRRMLGSRFTLKGAEEDAKDGDTNSNVEDSRTRAQEELHSITWLSRRAAWQKRIKTLDWMGWWFAYLIPPQKCHSPRFSSVKAHGGNSPHDWEEEERTVTME